MATQQAKKKDWKIPDNFAMFVDERCPDGKYLVCNVCSEYDDELSFCKVWSHGDFWTTSFKDHVCSARHKDNCVKKASFEVVQWRHLENGGEWPHKNLRQSTLNVCLIPLSSRQIHNQISLGVCPTLTSGNDASQDEVRLNLTCHFEAKKASIHFCQGVLAKKYLVNQAVQGGISYILKYMASSTYDGYKFAVVQGTTYQNRLPENSSVNCYRRMVYCAMFVGRS